MDNFLYRDEYLLTQVVELINSYLSSCSYRDITGMSDSEVDKSPAEKVCMLPKIMSCVSDGN